ncbi:hypothetical protein B6U99_03215 [Candidatus Geothermarchaeota archaeon ex4572_27]|nr:MAG: hypothetical protein B6U99_03215 [Candidatus Geothermarchaeota archaeon ex4572_27]
MKEAPLLAAATVLALLLAIALFYATFELPRLADELLRPYFPDVYAPWKPGAVEGAVAALRPYGYAALAVVALLIALGLLGGRVRLAALGSVALYLPTFGYFAFAMFFLAGLGVLRALWIPIMDASPLALRLGDIAFLPFLLLKSSPGLHGLGTVAAVAFVAAGLLTFSSGAVTWLYGRFRGAELVDFWAYRFCRHPQYLGYILWSYGLTLFTLFKPYVRGALATPPTAIWLLSTLIVVGVALYEEERMASSLGDRYEEYRRRTPFMVPLPRVVAELLALPKNPAAAPYHPSPGPGASRGRTKRHFPGGAI